jgi:uncharacterized protein YdeI (BOF family)
LYATGVNTVASTATSSETCTAPVSCSAHTVLAGGGAISLNTVPVTSGGTGATAFAQGWLGINNSGAFISSTSPTVAYLTATSTTATSTFYGPLVAGPNSAFLVQQNSGFVGIGTTTPQYPLDVYGTTAETIRASGSNTAYFDANGVGNSGYIISKNGNNIWYLYRDSANNFNIENNQTNINYVTVTPAGSTALGTSTPFTNDLLTLATSTGQNLTLSDTSSTANRWSLTNHSGTFYLATSSAATGATTTPAAITVQSTGRPAFSFATTSTTGILNLGANAGNADNGTSTISAGRFNLNVLDSSGAPACVIVATGPALVVTAGPCKNN